MPIIMLEPNKQCQEKNGMAHLFSLQSQGFRVSYLGRQRGSKNSDQGMLLEPLQGGETHVSVSAPGKGEGAVKAAPLQLTLFYL